MAGFAWLMTKQRLALGVAGLWLVTSVGFCRRDPAPASIMEAKPEPGMPAAAPDGSRVRRVITLNCKAGYFNPESAGEVIPWEPDVVLFQETAQPRACCDRWRRNSMAEIRAEHMRWGAGSAASSPGDKSCAAAQGDLPHTVSATIQFDDGTRWRPPRCISAGRRPMSGSTSGRPFQTRHQPPGSGGRNCKNPDRCRP